MQFNQPDTLVPDPYNPLDWNRYQYARANPIRYNDPTGHWPDWVDWLQGAVYQYANDMSMGLVDQITYSNGVCMDCNVSETYREGQQAGRIASTTIATVDQVTGAFVAAAGAAGIAPTSGGGSFCTIMTGGACAIPAGAALMVEGGMVVVGTGVAIYGTGVVAFSKNNPLENPGTTNGSWGNHSGQVKVINGQKIRIDWESPGENGNVHVTIGNEKYYITDPSDLSSLPKSLQKNSWVQREVERSFRQMGNFEESFRSK